MREMNPIHPRSHTWVVSLLEFGFLRNNDFSASSCANIQAGGESGTGGVESSKLQTVALPIREMNQIHRIA
jgi:hypothetical protein